MAGAAQLEIGVGPIVAPDPEVGFDGAGVVRPVIRHQAPFVQLLGKHQLARTRRQIGRIIVKPDGVVCLVIDANSAGRQRGGQQQTAHERKIKRFTRCCPIPYLPSGCIRFNGCQVQRLFEVKCDAYLRTSINRCTFEPQFAPSSFCPFAPLPLLALRRKFRRLGASSSNCMASTQTQAPGLVAATDKP